MRQHGNIAAARWWPWAAALLLIAGAYCLVARRSPHRPTGSRGSENSQSLSGLPSDEKLKVERYISRIEPAMRDTPVEVVARLVTADDVWIGMRYEGLFRYDRATGQWHSFAEGGIGERIERIWHQGSQIWVEHGIWGNHTYCYVDFTEDRGRTWIRFLVGDASGNYVHAPRFTNQGLRTERLRRITEALDEGRYPEELVEHLQVDQEVYFTIYVNSADGWCALYRYDLDSERLTDLAITERDPDAVGVRQFYADRHDEDLLWILSCGYGGAFQMPRRWFIFGTAKKSSRNAPLFAYRGK